jgi:tRNA (Thr-GGU) A37 N-methylase
MSDHDYQQALAARDDPARPLEALDGTPVIDVKPVLDKAAER